MALKTLTATLQKIEEGDDSLITPNIFKVAQDETKALLAIDVLPYFVSKQGEEIKK